MYSPVFARNLQCKSLGSVHCWFCNSRLFFMYLSGSSSKNSEVKQAVNTSPGCVNTWKGTALGMYGKSRSDWIQKNDEGMNLAGKEFCDDPRPIRRCWSPKDTPNWLINSSRFYGQMWISFHELESHGWWWPILQQFYSVFGKFYCLWFSGFRTSLNQQFEELGGRFVEHMEDWNSDRQRLRQLVDVTGISWILKVTATWFYGMVNDWKDWAWYMF